MQKQEKKKILYVITKSSWGGAQRYVYDLATHLSKEHEVTVAFGKNEFNGGDVFKEKLQNANVGTMQISSLGRDLKMLSDLKAFFALISLFRKEKPNIIHLNSSKIGILGGFAARITRVQDIVYTAHGLPFLEERPVWQNWLIRFATWLTFVFSHKVIVLSKFEEGRVKNWWFIKNKVHQIYNGIKMSTFLPRSQARAELAKLANTSISDSTYLVGSIAELTSNKGLLEFLPNLAEKIKEKEQEGIRCVYIHFGTGELAKKLKQETARRGLVGNVFWLGFVPEAGKYLKAFDLFTLPSKKEGLPYVLLEAKCAGVPIMASKVGGIPEILNGCVEQLALKSMLQKTFSIYERH